MTHREVDERLRQWHAAEVRPLDVPQGLWTAVAGIPDTVPALRRVSVRRQWVLLAAAIAAVLAMGALVAGSGLLDNEALDPARLDPCEVLPGPGISAAINDGQPIRHAVNMAPTDVEGSACAYGWDDGTNPHFQLRNQATTTGEGRALAEALFASGGQPAQELAVEGVQAWLGTSDWTSDQEAVEAADACVGMAVSSEPYFFVLWFTCFRPTDIPSIDMHDYRESGTEVVLGVLDNLAALNDGREPAYSIDRDWRDR